MKRATRWRTLARRLPDMWLRRLLPLRGRLRDGAEDLLERVKETVAAGAQAVEEAADAAQAAAAEEATEQAEAAAQAEEKPEKGTAAEAATEPQETEQPQEK